MAGVRAKAQAVHIAFFKLSAAAFGVILLLLLFFPGAWWLLLVWGVLFAMGLKDMMQTKRAVMRNFPIIGRFRYLFEMIRPEINQYFIESNTDGMPFNREQRSLVYQRAKGDLDTVPFGTQHDVYAPGYEWINHSIMPKTMTHDLPRVMIGKDRCTKAYSASVLNVSAMSFGSLSAPAIEALNLGAQMGGFAHNTGEGGISSYHLHYGGDLIWQIGTGYFGCRASNGTFDAEKFKANSKRPEVKMIEIKISQGAKPAHGGILPARKLTLEIAQIRGVPMGEDVNSPSAHSCFSTPIELLEQVAKLRALSDGKPVGIKLCIGKRREFLAIVKAMNETKLLPDYISIDGAEGGTGAAPLEFSNRIGTPLIEGLIFVHNALVGAGLREQLSVFAAGKVVTGFDLARLFALGADVCYSARAMMMAVGCIQARRCNNNDCPTGVATQNPNLMRGLVVSDKAPRVKRFHHETVRSLMEIIAASGMSHPRELRPHHILRRMQGSEIVSYANLYEWLSPGQLIEQKQLSSSWLEAWTHARADTFQSTARS